MPKLTPGRIVYPDIPVPDPNGKNPKSGRPFVIIGGDQDIAAGRVRIVAITSTLDEPLGPEYVKLQWGYQSQSKLSVKSVAQCGWVFTVPVAALTRIGGIIQEKELKAIRNRAAPSLGDLNA